MRLHVYFAGALLIFGHGAALVTRPFSDAGNLIRL